MLNLDYAYDGNGNCVQKSVTPYQNMFVYDQMNRLVEAVQNGKSEKYTYDLAGNRLKKESEQKTEHYQYNRKNQLIHLKTGETTTQYRYDQQGNLLEEQSNTWNKTYTYDAENRQRSTKLTKISNGIPEYFHQSNYYDGEGFRYKTEENGKIIRFLFDRGELAEEIQEDTHISYTRGNAPLALSRNGTNQNYFVSDEMGSTLFLLDQKHEIRKMYHYNAFGVIKEETGDVSNRLTYTGQIYDSVTGQYYLRARFYNPSIGRFTQEDIYRGSGLNLYAYCANNPVMYYDPSGYVWLCELGKNEPAYLIEDKVHKMIEFLSPTVHPKTVTPDNPDGIYIIRATGDYFYDRQMLALEAGISLPNGKYWNGHHIEYNIDTNEMRMQFAESLYHNYYSHFGGAGQFERLTGFKYGSDEAIAYCRRRNIDLIF